MTDMSITQLNVDLLQDQATITLFKYLKEPRSGKSQATNVSIITPVVLSGDQSESHIKRLAIEEAKKALNEALQVLDHQDL